MACCRPLPEAGLWTAFLYVLRMHHVRLLFRQKLLSNDAIRRTIVTAEYAAAKCLHAANSPLRLNSSQPRIFLKSVGDKLPLSWSEPEEATVVPGLTRTTQLTSLPAGGWANRQASH